MNQNPYTNVNEISSFLKICEYLDNSGDWRRLLSVLPDIYSKPNLLPNLEREDSKKHGTPSETLLFHLGNRGCTLGELVRFFEQLKIENALIFLKQFVPVNINGKLPENFTIRAGPRSQFRVECIASGFPSPQYQWFIFDKWANDWTELKDQQSSTFTLKPVRYANEGQYCCRVSNKNPANESEIAYDFSNPMTLTISKSSTADELDEKNNAPPVIIVQPSCPNSAQIIMGSSLILRCIAESETPITYEWYRNNVVIPDACSCHLTLNNLQPINDETKFTFQCRVSNCNGSVLSNMVAVHLAAPTPEIVSDIPQFTADDKFALLFANKDYKDAELTSAVFDAVNLAIWLGEMDFKVVTLINLTKTEMEQAVNEFCKLIDEGVYVVFYYAGHGYQQKGQGYMVPIDAADNCYSTDCLCLEYVLGKFQMKNPALCCMIIDTCRKDPPAVVDDSTYQPRVNRNTIIAFSTTYSCSALDGNDGQHGIYVKHLKKYIKAKKPIAEVFQNILYDMTVDQRACRKQYPQVVCNLGRPLKLTDKIKSENPERAEQRRQHYQSLIDHRASFDVLGTIPGTTLHVHLEPFDQVIHNLLSVKIIVSSDTPNQSHIAVIKQIVTADSQQYATFMQEYDKDNRLLEAQIHDLQKIREPLVLEISMFNEHQHPNKLLISLDYPMIAKAKLWQA